MVILKRVNKLHEWRLFLSNRSLNRLSQKHRIIGRSLIQAVCHLHIIVAAKIRIRPVGNFIKDTILIEF